MGSGGSDSGPHASMANALPKGPSSLPFHSNLGDVCVFCLPNCAGQNSTLNCGDMSGHSCLIPHHRGKLSPLSINTETYFFVSNLFRAFLIERSGLT